MVIVGYRKVNYTSRKTGNAVNGFNIYCHFDNDSIVGVGVKEFYISSNKIKEDDIDYYMKCNAHVIPLYDENKRVIRLDVED